jgi:type III pantothenate kinase
MLLAIDCGNTNTVFALMDDGNKLIQEWRMATDADKTGDDYALFLDHHLMKSGFEVGVVTDIVISTVVPSGLRALQNLASHYSAPSLVIDPATGDHGVQVNIPEPKQAGADRIANTKAASEYSVPAIVIDFGTATTFDVIDAQGAYVGGVIAPGVNLSINVLHEATARLPLIDADTWSEKTPVLGSTTVDAMNSGLYYGYTSLVEGMIARLKEAHGQDMTVIATGGLARTFSKSVPGINYYDPDLTVKGMAMIYADWKQRN